ncbi:protein roadkill-like [Planococcus citri]|uniref:protein roadkill-like n=1 Tax=Planococcus citri TaxID=170843 RepID=UPI0031F821DB
MLRNADAKFHEIKYNWTIPQFSAFESKTPWSARIPVKSVRFPTLLNKLYEWEVLFYPNGVSGSQDSISLILRLHCICGFEKAVVNFKASVMDRHYREVRSKEDLREFISGGMIIEWNEFCHKDKIFRNKLLFNNQLIIFVHISYYIQCQDLPSNIAKCDLSNSLASLLKNPKFADVQLNVSSGKSYWAHRAILASRSGFFARKFNEIDKEKRYKKVLLHVTDTDRDVMDAVLRYIYTGGCETSNNLTDRLLMAADKFEVHGLVNICLESLSDIVISVKNAANVLVSADKYHLHELKSRVIEYIVGHWVDVLKSVGWKRMVGTNTHLVNEMCQILAKRSNKNQIT